MGDFYLVIQNKLQLVNYGAQCRRRYICVVVVVAVAVAEKKKEKGENEIKSLSDTLTRFHVGYIRHFCVSVFLWASIATN